MNFRRRRPALDWTAMVAFCCFIQVGCASVLQSDNALTPHPPDPSIELKFGLARMVERNGSLSEARDAYREIIELEPDHGETLHRLGVVSIQLEDLDAALAYLSHAMDSGTPSSDLLGDFGYAQLLNGDLEAAESNLRDAVELAPQNDRLTNNLALVVGRQGRLDESLELFRRVNSESEAQANIAFVLSGVGEFDAAKQHYHQALARDPNLKKAAHGLSEFYRLGDDDVRNNSRSPQWIASQVDSTTAGSVPAETNDSRRRGAILAREK